MFNDNQVNRFFEVYTVKLRECAERKPEQYPWFKAGSLTVEAVAGRMRNTVVDRGLGAVDYSGGAWKATCRQLNLKHNRKTIHAFLMGEVL